jgi:polyhydroxybutyrate depolymerase
MPKHWRLRAARILVAAITLGGCDSLLDPDADRIRSQTIVTGGLIRTYDWAEPGGEGLHPVLLAFHGAGGNPTEYRQNSGLVDPATDAGYVVVFPQAANETERTWAMGCAGCTQGDELGIDDVAFVDALLDDLARRTSIDRSRVYVTGFSMGGWFSYAFACQRSSAVKAIAPVGGLMPRPVAQQCAPVRPIGALVIFGDLDQTQPYGGRAGPYGLLGADSSAIFWSVAANCRVEIPDEVRAFGETAVRITEQTDCDGGVHVERHRVVGMAHVWPSGRYDATRELLRFFDAH